MNSVMALDVVRLELPDVDTFEERSKVFGLWMSRPWYYPKRMWIEKKILSVFRSATLSDISKKGATVTIGENVYRFEFDTNDIMDQLVFKRFFGVVIPLSDFPFVLYMDHGTFKINAYDGMDIARVFRHELVYNELNTAAICNHVLIPAVYDALSGKKSLLDACVTGNGTNTLDVVLMALTLAGAEFPESLTENVTEEIFRYGFKLYDEK